MNRANGSKILLFVAFLCAFIAAIEEAGANLGVFNNPLAWFFGAIAAWFASQLL